MTTPSTEIIIPLRQPWLTLILNGTKTAELRRTHPSYIPDRLYLYHRRCIHGHADVAAWHTDLTPAQTHRHHRIQLCLTAQQIAQYLREAANPIVYNLANITPYPHPIPIPAKPQTWIYMTPAIRTLLPEHLIS